VRTTRAKSLSWVMSLAWGVLLASSVASAATYPELAARRSVPYTANGNGVFAAAPGMNGYASAYPVNGGAGYPAGGNAMRMLPNGGNGLPDARQVRWSYGQVNAASDPFFVWGLRTQGMYVPWSTPMSSWTNAQGWDWWRNRAGDGGPSAPLW